MGIMDWLGFSQSAAIAAAQPLQFASPWNGGDALAPIVIADVFGLDSVPVTRTEAMSVPAVARGRHLIADVLGRQPIKAFKDGAALQVQPAWLTRTDGPVGPRMRNVWTLDDLIFNGYSLWTVSRGSDGFPLAANRVPLERWRFSASGQVEYLGDDGKWFVPDPNSVVLIPGPCEGLLTIGARTVRAYRDLERAWQSRVHSPLPTMEIQYTGDDIIDDTDIAKAKKSYIDARNDPNGAVVVSPPGWALKSHSMEGLDLFESGRNAVVLDAARFLNIPATLLDASNTNASSVTYASTESARSWYHDSTLRSWALPLEERLSADDMVPRGTYVEFDLSELVEIPDNGVGPTLDD